MDLHLSRRKPDFNPIVPLCTFRSSKAYLWGLIRERLNSLQAKSDSPLHILDAACHSLIARAIFPNSSLYYGLDISQSRLKAGFNVKRETDILFHADLCLDLGIQSCFDAVVSCNTLSHLPDNQVALALQNVINTCKNGGSLFVNMSIGQNMSDVSCLLSKHFSRLEVVYFDSYLSFKDESKSLINTQNIIHKLQSNEFLLPNDACLHHQILYIASGYLSASAPIFPPSKHDQIIRLNSIPNVSMSEFRSDVEAMKFLEIEDYRAIFLTRKLFDSSAGSLLRNNLTNLNCVVHPLEFPLPTISNNKKVGILGLEKEWSDTLAVDRHCVNQLREISDIQLKLLAVNHRNSSVCTPSLLLSDC